MKRIANPVSLLMLMFAVETPFLTTALGQDWSQWGRDPQHASQINAVGQNLNQNIADVIYDSSVPDELNVASQLFGEPVLLIHYQVPLIDGNDV